MCFNAGIVDRTLRVTTGLGLIGFGLMTQNHLVAGVGALTLITGLVGFCPFYPLLKIDTGCGNSF